MQSVSQKWKENQEGTLVSESFVELSVNVGDPEAIDDGTISDNGSTYYSDTNGLLSEASAITPPYATFEQNLFVLNGDLEFISSDYTKGGYISEVLSNKDGNFTTPPTLVIDFTGVHDVVLPGVTVIWGESYGDYPTAFTITAYNHDTIVAQKEVVDNSTVETVVFVDIVNYNRITIEINKWCLPYRRARVEDVTIGVKKVYRKNDIFSLKMSQEIDPISATLPKNTLSFSVDNMKGEYNPDKNEGLSKYLAERQPINLRYGYKIDGDVEWIDGGTYYMTGWSAKSNSRNAEFESSDIFGHLTMLYDKSQYSADGKTLYDIATEILTFANLQLQEDGTVSWVLDESLKDVTVSTVLPIDTVANCLQLVANAGCCVLYQDRKGVIHIEKRSETVSDYTVNLDNSYSKPETVLDPAVKQVTVNVYSYTQGETEAIVAKFPRTTLRRGLTVNDTPIQVIKDFRIVFDTPSVLTKLMTSGAYCNSEVISANDYYVDVRVTTNVGTLDAFCSINVYGYSLETSTSSMTFVDSSVKDGEEITIDNPLISSVDHATKVAEWVQSVVKARRNKSLSWRPDVRLDVGDNITVTDEYSSEPMFMTKVEYAYNGAFRGSGEGKVI